MLFVSVRPIAPSPNIAVKNSADWTSLLEDENGDKKEYGNARWEWKKRIKYVNVEEKEEENEDKNEKRGWKVRMENGRK